jgi:hypothetical protein
MPLPRLYVVQSDMHGRWDTEYMPVESARYGDAPTCPQCGAFIGARKWLDPLRASVSVHGEAPGDFGFFGSADFLVTRAAVASLRVLGIAAFEDARPVDVAASRGWPLHDIPRYVYPELPVGPAADLDRSVIVSARANPCEWCGPNAADAIGPIYVEEATWEDVELFVPRRVPGVTLATQRFVDAVHEAGLTGITFVAANQHRWDPLNLLGD